MVLVSALTVIEEPIVGLTHEKTLGASLAAIGGGTPEQTIATTIGIVSDFLAFFGIIGSRRRHGHKDALPLFFAERRAFERYHLSRKPNRYGILPCKRSAKLSASFANLGVAHEASAGCSY